MMLSSVDLPQPDGPTMQRNSDALDAEADVLDAGDPAGGRVVDERDVADFDMGHDLRRSAQAVTLRRAHHAPAQHRGALDRAEHQALEHEADHADHGERGQHHVGVEEFLGVEDHPAQTPVGGGEHLGADDRDPGAQERLAQPVMMKGEAPGMITFQNKRVLVARPWRRPRAATAD